MIFAKISTVTNSVVTYPIQENELREIFNTSSLPVLLTESNLPEDYVFIFDKNGKMIPSTLATAIANLEPLFITGKWRISKAIEDFVNLPTIETESLETFLISRLKELVTYTEKLAHDVTGLYKIPSVESQTWDMQFAEALAWSKDNEALTPTLDMIALSRGINKVTLKEKALEKALAYQLVISFIVGKKQYFEDLLTAATTVAELREIVFNIDISEIADLLEKEAILSTP